MKLETRFVSELDNGRLAYKFFILVHLTTHLHELNMHLHGKNKLINTVFHIITTYKMKLKK